MFLIEENGHLLDTEEDTVTLTLRFATDGAKMSKNINSVRGVVCLVKPRETPDDCERLAINSPNDELTLYLYTGKFHKVYSCRPHHIKRKPWFLKDKNKTLKLTMLALNNDCGSSLKPSSHKSKMHCRYV